MNTITNTQAKEIIAHNRAKRGDVSEVKIGNRTFREGDRFKVTGERGEFMFTSARVKNGECLWVDCFQCDRRFPGHARSFVPNRVGVKRRKVEAS